MATWNVQTKDTDKNGKQSWLGQVLTKIADRGRAQELAERHFGNGVTVTRESHLEQDRAGKVHRVED